MQIPLNSGRVRKRGRWEEEDRLVKRYSREREGQAD